MGTVKSDTSTTSMDVERARDALRRGLRLRIVVGRGVGDPTLVLWLDGGAVISEAVAGWSAGVVEPVCGIESDFLRTYLQGRASIEIVDAGRGSARPGDAGWSSGVCVPDGWDRIDGQATVQLPDGRTFAVVRGRRWTRVHEYLSNGQLTARWFVDESTGEAREAESARKPRSWRLSGGAAELARWVVKVARVAADYEGDE